MDDLLNTYNSYLDVMVDQIYPSESQLLNKINSSTIEALFLALHLTISDGFASSKIYDKRDYFDFDIENFPFVDGDIPHAPSHGFFFYISAHSVF